MTTELALTTEGPMVAAVKCLFDMDVRFVDETWQLKSQPTHRWIFFAEAETNMRTIRAIKFTNSWNKNRTKTN